MLASTGRSRDDRVEHAGDALELQAGDELGEVDGVGSDVAEGAGAGEILLQAPGERNLGVDEPVLAVARAHLVDGADRSGCDEVASEGGRGHAAVGEADHRVDAAGEGALGGIRHRLGLFDGVGEGLLAEHVLAGLEGGDGDLGVRVAGGHDVDDVDVVAFDGGAPVGRALLPAPLAGRRPPRHPGCDRR